MVLSRTTMLRALLAAALLLAGSAAAAQQADAENPGLKKAPTDVGRYVVRAAGSEDLRLDPPKLPDLAPYTHEAMMSRIERKGKAQISVRRMVNEPALHEFVGGHDRLAEWAARQNTNPLAIYIQSGYATPKDLARELSSSHFVEQDKGVYLLRLPLLVHAGATLHIDAATKEFRMSRERGAFLVNAGKLFVTETKLLAWSESDDAPAKFRKPTDFRPFLVSWGGSETYISRSEVAHLGYAASKSYGVSLSQYSPSLDHQMNQPRPTGWILHSEFHDNWYGFYCYEADDVVIVGNDYRDNIVYGIDPHDRSRRLIIAENTATGVAQKHGIIISREVDDSWIFRNRASGNRLAGIVLDRSSKNNVVAYNDVHGNYGDGITIYESPDNLLWGNRVVGNARHGIRLRNSVDVRLYHNDVVGNRLTGIYGHIKDLTGTDRNLELDPFELKVSTVVVGGQLSFNGSAPIAIDRPLSVELYDVAMLAPTKRSGIELRGVLGEMQAQLLDILYRQRKAAVIEPAEGRPPKAGPVPAAHNSKAH